MKYSLQNIILEIHNKEDQISSQSKRLIDEAYEMTLYLQDLLFSVKNDIIDKGFNTNELVPVSLNLGTAVTRMDARLSLQQNDQGAVVVAIHGIRKEPNLNFEFFGHKFTKEDKDNLLQSGNMGRVVNLTNPKTGE